MEIIPIRLATGRDVYDYDPDVKIVDFSMEFVDHTSGEISEIQVIPLAEEEHDGLADVIGIPCAYIDYHNGKFVVWPRPEYEIDAKLWVVR